MITRDRQACFEYVLNSETLCSEEDRINAFDELTRRGSRYAALVAQSSEHGMVHSDDCDMLPAMGTA